MLSRKCVKFQSFPFSSYGETDLHAKTSLKSDALTWVRTTVITEYSPLYTYVKILNDYKCDPDLDLENPIFVYKVDMKQLKDRWTTRCVIFHAKILLKIKYFLSLLAKLIASIDYKYFVFILTAERELIS
jgi:hypothetical protein